MTREKYRKIFILFFDGTFQNQFIRIPSQFFRFDFTIMIWKKRYSELFTLSFFILMINTVFLFELLIIRPYLIENNLSNFTFLHILFAIYLFVNTLLNLYLCITTNTSIAGIVMPTIKQSDDQQWPYCLRCETYVPPRAFHCKICDTCILRRDHHCVFTACCIGHKNYKYFMGLLLNVGVGCIYAISMHWQYIWANINHLGWWAIGAHSLPIVFYVLGMINLSTTLCNMISMICVVGAIFATGLFIYHLNILRQNLTTFERTNSINDYDLNDWKDNLRETLGNNWMMTIFLCPLIKSDLSNDFSVYFSKKNLQNKQI